jgi:YfiH family protein
MRPQPGAGFEWIDAPGPALICRPLGEVAPHLFTTRAWALGSADENGAVNDGWREVASAAGVATDRLARLHQVHGGAVVVRRAAERSDDPLPRADIIVTDDPGLAVAIQTADCVPMLIADRRTGAVGAAHAGWRGLASGVPSLAVSAMARHFGTRAADLIVAIGPSISAERYEVGADVRQRFEAGPFGPEQIAGWFPAVTRPDHWSFDGQASARDQLVAAGVPPEQIHLAGLCTAAHADLLCSYRRDGARAGRLAAVIRAT